jgi:hypothetical protein
MPERVDFRVEHGPIVQYLHRDLTLRVAS